APSTVDRGRPGPARVVDDLPRLARAGAHRRLGPGGRGQRRMTMLKRLWSRDGQDALTACTSLDVGTEFAKALVFEIGDDRRATVRGVGRKRQGLAHMQSGTVADISAVVDNCSVALQEA